MRKTGFFFLVILLFTVTESTSKGQHEKLNSLTDKEIKEGWKLLFDGRTSDGWMNAISKAFPSKGWEIKDEALIIRPENGPGGDILTTGKYKNFELVVDFKYEKDANSGIKYFVDSEINNGDLASIGCEYQILDDKNSSDAKDNHKMAGLYDLIAPSNVKDEGPGVWNRAKIIVKGNHVQHWLNGLMTVEYERGTLVWKDLVATSKFKTSSGFGDVKEGRILLQDHGGTVAFRNIKIREIKE
jgi:hypothetical protein